jgi:hypothetical protein
MEIVCITVCCFLVGVIILGLLGIVAVTMIDLFKVIGMKDALICFGILALFFIIATAIGYLILYIL